MLRMMGRGPKAIRIGVGDIQGPSGMVLTIINQAWEALGMKEIQSLRPVPL